jgi:hypothetical protein
MAHSHTVHHTTLKNAPQQSSLDIVVRVADARNPQSLLTGAGLLPTNPQQMSPVVPYTAAPPTAAVSAESGN